MQQAPSGFTHILHDPVLPSLHDGVEAARHKVLIAGGGPVGLAVALALARHRIPSVVFEAADTVCIGSRAICLSRRTLEILDRLGVLQPFVDKGLPWTGGRSFYRNDEVLKFAMPHDANQRLAPMTNLQQYYIEQFLVDAVERQSDMIDLRWCSRVTDVTQDDDGLAATVRTAGHDHRVAADYLVACDGARSSVRQALGLKMAGTSYEGRYVIADIEIAMDLPTERLAWFDPPSAPGRTLLMHRQPDELWRIDYQLHASEDSDEMIRQDNVSAVVEAHLHMMGVTNPWRIVWISMYRAAALSLADYRHGRVLFAGDAAHLVPIFGVRGLNGGLDDAFNLGWKLAYRLKEIAGDAILDNYGAERHFAWATNIAQAMKSTEFMAPPSRGFEIMRSAVLSLSRSHPALSALINPRQSSAIGYANSPLNTASEEAHAFDCGPAPGDVIPEAPVRHVEAGETFLTSVLSDDFTLFAFQPGDAIPWEPSTTAAVNLVRIWPRGDAPATGGGAGRDIVDSRGIVFDLFDATPGTAYLIRPDGHVCARWRRQNPGRLCDAVTTATAAHALQRAMA